MSTGHGAVTVLCSWVGNRRSGDTPRPCITDWYIHLWAQMALEKKMSSPPMGVCDRFTSFLLDP